MDLDQLIREADPAQHLQINPPDPRSITERHSANTARAARGRGPSADDVPRPRLGSVVAVLGSLAVVIGVGAVLLTGAPRKAATRRSQPQPTSPRVSMRSLLARPLHFPALGADGQCPVSAGYAINNAYFGGDALGKGPVRVLLGDAGDITHGRVNMYTGRQRRWDGLQTLWFAMPAYNGPFVVRGARLGKPGPIAVQPGDSGLSPGSGPLVVPAGPTLNTYWTKWRRGHLRDPISGRLVATITPEYGYRTVPGSTWIKSPGCYAWQVDGRGFSDVIVFDAIAQR